MSFKFKQFQIEDLARGAMHDGCILAWEQGLGKTPAALAWPLIKQARRTLLVVPEGLHLQFIETARDFFKLSIRRLDGIEAIGKLGLNNPLPEGAPPEFYMTTYQELGHNGADEWLPAVDGDGFVIRNPILHKRRMDHPEIQKAIVAAMLVARLQGQPKPAPEEIADEFFADIGLEREIEKGYRITCIWQPCLARVLAQMDCFDCVVVDEGTRLQANESHVGMGVRFLNPKYRLVLTGTPVKNKLDSIFWLAWWACGGHAEATARWPYAGTTEARETFANQHLQHDRFVTREAESEAKTPRKIERRSARICNIHRLWKLLAPIVLRRRKDECGEDIVDKIVKPINVPPGTEQLGVYNFHLTHPPTHSKTGAELKDRTVVGMQLNILRQAALCPDTPALAEVITQPYYPPPGVKPLPKRSTTSFDPKTAAILSLVADLVSQGEQVIIGSPFTHFNFTLHYKLRVAGISSIMLDGSVPPKKRALMAQEFKAHRYSTMVAGIKAMGEGNSFECCSHLILPSWSWAYDENEQFIHRVWRLNSPKPVTIWPISMDNTIDARLYELFDEKGDSAQLALDGRLFTDKVEEIDLALLLSQAVKSFNPAADTVDEQMVRQQWNAVLKGRIGAAEAAFRAFHAPPPEPGKSFALATAMQQRRAAGDQPPTDWAKVMRQLRAGL